jgi:GH24 family phage-related lysozyme (muramidase)|tara:strand:- start:2525 stop:3058 length:534 start_codon:yes stop_codon:yes gene_type:complete
MLSGCRLSLFSLAVYNNIRQRRNVLKESKMNKSEVFETLKVDEGVKYEIYNDHLGYPTFGVGHLVLKTDPEYGQPTGTAITKERVEECFDNDLGTAVSECHALYGQGTFDNLPDEVQGILVNMMFNMGRTRLSKFKKMNAALLENDWKTAAVEGRDSRWHKQVTNRAERLMVRLESV